MQPSVMYDTDYSDFISDAHANNLTVIPYSLKNDLLQLTPTLDAEIAKLANEGIAEQELQKTKNRQEAVVEFTNVEVLNRAINLAMCALLGDANFVNSDPEKISLVTLEQMNDVCSRVFAPHKANTLMYKSIKEA